MKTLIYTEEPEHSLREKLEAFNVSESFIVYHWELALKRWTETIDWLVQAAIDVGAGDVDQRRGPHRPREGREDLHREPGPRTLSALQ